MSRAKLYVNIHKLIAAGNRARADDLRRLIPATVTALAEFPH
jgi:hypothetical protein